METNLPAATHATRCDRIRVFFFRRGLMDTDAHNSDRPSRCTMYQVRKSIHIVLVQRLSNRFKYRIKAIKPIIVLHDGKVFPKF